MWPRPSDTRRILESRSSRLGGARSTCSEPCCPRFPFASCQPACLTPATQRPVEPPLIIASGCACGVFYLPSFRARGRGLLAALMSHPSALRARHAPTSNPALRVHPCLCRCPSPAPICLITFLTAPCQLALPSGMDGPSREAVPSQEIDNPVSRGLSPPSAFSRMLLPVPGDASD